MSLCYVSLYFLVFFIFPFFLYLGNQDNRATLLFLSEAMRGGFCCGTTGRTTHACCGFILQIHPQPPQGPKANPGRDEECEAQLDPILNMKWFVFDHNLKKMFISSLVSKVKRLILLFFKLFLYCLFQEDVRKAICLLGRRKNNNKLGQKYFSIADTLWKVFHCFGKTNSTSVS